MWPGLGDFQTAQEPQEASTLQWRVEGFTGTRQMSSCETQPFMGIYFAHCPPRGSWQSTLTCFANLTELFWLFSVLCIRQHIHEERKDFLWRHTLTIYSTGWPQFLYLCASAPWVLGLETCATVSGSDCILQCIPILWLNTLKHTERHYGGFGDSLSLNSISTNHLLIRLL